MESCVYQYAAECGGSIDQAATIWGEKNELCEDVIASYVTGVEIFLFVLRGRRYHAQRY